MRFEDYFSFQIFFIFLRESLEIVIIVSILLTIVRQALSVNDKNSIQNETDINNTDVSVGSSQLSTNPETAPMIDNHLTIEEEEEEFETANTESQDIQPGDSSKLYSKLKIQIISGGALGLLLCLLIGGSFITIFYHIGSDLWSLSEHYYEGILSIVASVIISVMGLFFLRMGKLREKFRIKLASIIYSDRGKMFKDNADNAVKFSEKYAFFILPFVTTLREGLEAVVFIGGVGIDQPLTSIPLSMLLAVCVSGIFGYYFFKYSSSLSLKICLVVTTCFLYLIASGLFSKGVWQLEVQDYVNKCNGQDMTEIGNGPGSYDIVRSIWHVNCCNGEKDGGWMILTAIFGWTNSATYGSVISYNIYWLVLIGALKLLIVEEQHGYIPFLPVKFQKKRILKRMAISKASINLRQNTNSIYQPPSTDSTRTSKDSETPLIEHGNNNAGFAHGAT
ncbi:similar to Saccharomyces cerevisiae YBR207W FTH1 Putative high affinity iron transporter involved in transport of intravacuolar stores of iron [Maudiozyma barnettii]|uniref:Similar to Saccharomyces cerevisiae YBR207W FTH1 Putative high affinity iron transporter involved in transport of intravacuolar stores of iron n=1 Tax=Maudiozyma barnettii TaxID=61262 RepID=A0A8H2VEL5_9SACH|nr:Fth1p [Kazachstania barnettii]CAB4253694.1 similar to Saccharomyces cerevisiae YBR207W FTH1 Putative high affinity iron transporter involved in transport of intravacuolar stores of iron [Kazachstania barnettii]CAD1781420.1 similar to Saccharomyces cerevisiae YBR207W FTH1 Putative high affinity iron transporter involved in transport of intravacuolar stores of iron [Kazachstania barnettii]